MRILLVTNDFPPSIGGVEDYVAQLAARLRDDQVTVFASDSPGSKLFDRGFPHPVIRWPVRTLLPTPAVRRRLFDVIGAESPDVVVFGAAMPLALLGPPIRRRFGVPYVTFTHGLEVAAARLPGGQALLRRIGRDAALVTTVSRWTAEILRPCLGSATRVVQLPVGVDVERFRPDVAAAEVRDRHSLGSGPIISAVSRLVPRKGHDQVIMALPEIRHAFPAVRFLVVGAGRDQARLRTLATRHGVDAHVVFAGAVRRDDLPAYFRAGDVFAMPCRHRWAGLDVEAFGSVYLQAAAVGRVTVAGRVGGVPEAVVHGQSGLVVDGTHVGEVAAALLNLLGDPDRAAAMGEWGAARARTDFSWDLIAARLHGLLQDVLSRA